VRICIQSSRPNHHSDCDNQAKAIIDSAQQAGVIPNDMWIDSLQVRREFGAADCVEFEVFPI
jgi:Holliday junction resolvase RusA-like endonuclease